MKLIKSLTVKIKVTLSRMPRLRCTAAERQHYLEVGELRAELKAHCEHLVQATYQQLPAQKKHNYSDLLSKSHYY